MCRHAGCAPEQRIGDPEVQREVGHVGVEVVRHGHQPLGEAGRPRWMRHAPGPVHAVLRLNLPAVSPVHLGHEGGGHGHEGLPDVVHHAVPQKVRKEPGPLRQRRFQHGCPGTGPVQALDRLAVEEIMRRKHPVADVGVFVREQLRLLFLPLEVHRPRAVRESREERYVPRVPLVGGEALPPAHPAARSRGYHFGPRRHGRRLHGLLGGLAVYTARCHTLRRHCRHAGTVGLAQLVRPVAGPAQRVELGVVDPGGRRRKLPRLRPVLLAEYLHAEPARCQTREIVPNFVDAVRHRPHVQLLLERDDFAVLVVREVGQEHGRSRARDLYRGDTGSGARWPPDMPARRRTAWPGHVHRLPMAAAFHTRARRAAAANLQPQRGGGRESQ
mmetsp:Transcript_6516/g.17099  ORF Transcript_6516/g.17099 Transcript_6516/m.17099 type:complete len:386 (+) Transcript_6516:279-1436(+)